MTQLRTKVELYAKAKGVSTVDFDKDVTLRDDSDGKGAYIETWNLSIAKPNTSELASYEDAAKKEETNNMIKYTRKLAYGYIEDQLDDIYHNGIDEWKKTIKAVKDKYPKE